MQINPVQQYAFYNAGDVIHFNIKISSTSEVTEFRIIDIQDDGVIDTLLLNQGANIQKEFSYQYQTLNSSEHDTLELKLLFYSRDINGKSHEVVRFFSVISAEVLLTEYAGQTMYSSRSTDFNAYDLLECQPRYSADSTSHINDELDTISDILSRKWISVSNLNFTKANNLDYANATSYTLQNVYESSLKKEFVDDIQEDDIIITLIDNSYIAIKLIYVIDNVGVENDKYIFNIKK